MCGLLKLNFEDFYKGINVGGSMKVSVLEEAREGTIYPSWLFMIPNEGDANSKLTTRNVKCAHFGLIIFFLKSSQCPIKFVEFKHLNKMYMEK